MANDSWQLKDHIVHLSDSETWDEARTEWVFDGAILYEDWYQCPCGTPIKEVCYLRNLKNSATTYVGNVCVRRFMDIDTGTLFQGLRRIQENDTANANEAVIEYAFQRGFIDRRDYYFLYSTRRKRNMSDKALQWKRDINHRILQKVVRRRGA